MSCCYKEVFEMSGGHGRGRKGKKKNGGTLQSSDSSFLTLGKHRQGPRGCLPERALQCSGMESQS